MLSLQGLGTQIAQDVTSERLCPQELRSSLVLAEMERLGGVANHMSPLTRMRDCGDLLQTAGFSLLTVTFKYTWRASDWLSSLFACCPQIVLEMVCVTIVTGCASCTHRFAGCINMQLLACLHRLTKRP